MQNTRIEYLYTDADNYIVTNYAIVPGRFTKEQIDQIIGSLDEGEYFIPRKVGMPEKKFDDTTEADHDWFKLHAADFIETDEIENLDVKPDVLTARFLACKGRWETAIDMEAW